MSGAALRWDCLQEAQLGDVVILPEMADFSIFGSKTDPTLAGQAAVLPASDARNSGTRALVEGTRAGLMRLAALPPLVLQQAASRLPMRAWGRARSITCWANICPRSRTSR